MVGNEVKAQNEHTWLLYEDAYVNRVALGMVVQRLLVISSHQHHYSSLLSANVVSTFQKSPVPEELSIIYEQV